MTKKQETFLAVYRQHYGTVKSACAAAKISRSTFYEWSKQAEFKAVLDEAMEEMLDNAESKLHELINGVMVKGSTNGKMTVYKKAPDFRAIKFFLSTKGKSRGYTERFEIENRRTDAQTLKIAIDYGDNKIDDC